MCLTHRLVKAYHSISYFPGPCFSWVAHQDVSLAPAMLPPGEYRICDKPFTARKILGEGGLDTPDASTTWSWGLNHHDSSGCIKGGLRAVDDGGCEDFLLSSRLSCPLGH